jgi:hypothetical protein
MLGEEAEGWNGKHERSEGLHKRNRGPRRAFFARWGGGARKTAGNPLRRARAEPSARLGFLMRAR